MRPRKVKFMLMAANMRRAVAFYRDVLGFQERHVSEWWSELALGDAILALHGGHDGSKNPTGLSLEFEDVLAACDALHAGGALIIEFPKQREGEPILLGAFQDAEGNQVAITQYLGAE